MGFELSGVDHCHCAVVRRFQPDAEVVDTLEKTQGCLLGL
jgi:hypothetical protein